MKDLIKARRDAIGNRYMSLVEGEYDPKTLAARKAELSSLQAEETFCLELDILVHQLQRNLNGDASPQTIAEELSRQVGRVQMEANTVTERRAFLQGLIHQEESPQGA